MTAHTTKAETSVVATPPGAKQVVVYQQWARTLVLASNTDRAEAIETLKAVKEKKAFVVEFFRDMKGKAHAAWKGIVEKEASYTKVLEEVERTVKSVVLRYDQEQEALRLAEERRLQAEADAQAEAERKRLLSIAARTKNPERKAERLAEAEAVEASLVEVAPTLEHQEGETTRLLWKARVVNLTLVPRKWLIVDEKALQAHARATKGEEAVPGVEFYSETSLAIGGR